MVEKARIDNKSFELLHAHIDRKISIRDIGITTILGSGPGSIFLRFMSTTTAVVLVLPLVLH